MSLLKVDLSKPLFQYLYYSLYQRILNTALANNDNATFVKSRLIALVAEDERIHLLIDLQDSEIVAHCLVSILNQEQACIEQLDYDKSSPSGLTFFKDCLTHIEAIPTVTNITIHFNEDEYQEFKDEFKVYKVSMTRKVSHEVESND